VYSTHRPRMSTSIAETRFATINEMIKRAILRLKVPLLRADTAGRRNGDAKLYSDDMRHVMVLLGMAKDIGKNAITDVRGVGAREHINYAKFKWSLDENNYRVAVITKKGMLQVKSVTNGKPELQKMSSRTSPLKLTMFPCESAWRKSLPPGGSVDVTSSRSMTDWWLQQFCNNPLVSTTDPLKLREIERRFPGARIVFHSPEDLRATITYIDESSILCDECCCGCSTSTSPDFKSIRREGARLLVCLDTKDPYDPVKEIDISHLI